ncbi:hypothetical protein COV23_02510 [Candidatus Wolfebacteria bacterium CG10_big_fil_rev_8_21_14_0_10_31_9]|uniref:RNase H type-1 domain-containing protein n=1 Tax=Candidatus Wolfebacteria bacterium CG10_big_fil_rev_8_21_14_0_10_31_9 TaxID=1975070 RepID=A0A2H0RBQ7_9BACT|nr:MAG: hypothetical protein COV23_02510 [Candidatus Wolfebacteria bacterium CG10_big_fil_rev_8_21_14_0_10_31_9]
MKIIIYTDGGSRNNPGPAALGVYFIDFNKEYSEFLGTATNNEAEYQGVVFALKKAKQLIGKENAKKTEIEIKADSELIVKQLNGEYKLKEEKLIAPFIEIWNLKQEYKKVSFTHIPREQNKKADLMVNKELDNQQKELF